MTQAEAAFVAFYPIFSRYSPILLCVLMTVPFCVVVESYVIIV